MQGRIIKGVAGVYDVHVEEYGVLACKAKGVFRKNGVKPLVGDLAEVSLIDEEKNEGLINRILPRINSLIRPAVANVDQALVIFAAASPKPNFNLLDRFLLMMEQQNVPVLICFNKTDLVRDEELLKLKEIYENCGYPMIFTSADKKEGVVELKNHLKDKTTVVAGPSGVGKSSLINLLQGSVVMETGKISAKIERGRHTTRHSEMIPIDKGSYIFDTPGFSSLQVFDSDKEDIKKWFPEFAPYEEDCRFLNCLHKEEPQCGVKQALADGKISLVRYENYRQILEEIESRKKY